MNRVADKKIFVGMSGGVDSSVAAYLLKKQGYDVTGVFMRCYNLDGCSEKDAEDARRVAEHLKIPFYVWDFEDEYKKKVVDYMVRGYEKGITPNPDVMCNREIKFGLFLNRALKMGADYVATGHYVRKHGTWTIEHGKKKEIFQLAQAKDPNKDQSYFLWTLTQKQLQHCLFPIGDYLKSKVREIARRAGLPTADKKDSQGICFLGMVSVDEFLEKYIPKKKGDVLDAKGKKIGEHIGAHFYTIGQRQGLGHKTWNMKLVSRRGKDRGRFYVAEKNAKKNTMVVAEGENNPMLCRKEIHLADVNFIDSSYFLIRANKKIKPVFVRNKHSNILKNVGMLRHGIDVLARVRYRQPLALAALEKSQAPNSKQRAWRLIFREPQKFVAEGQSAVFYIENPSARSGRSQGLRMLGGGIIV